MAFKITEIYAFIAVGPDGDEGVCGFQSAGTFMPMVCADQARVDSLRPVAVSLAAITGARITLAKFSVREDMEVIS